MKIKGRMIAAGFLAFLFLLSACTQPPVKPTEEIRRIQQIDRFLEGLRHLVQTKDLRGLSAKYPQDQQDEIRDLSRAIHSIEQPQLDFFVDRIVLDQDMATVALHWEFRWKQSPDTGSFARRGDAVFRLKGSQNLTIEAITGNNPFLAPMTGKVLSP